VTRQARGVRLLPDLHVSGRPSATAQWTTLTRALELDRPEAERIVTDQFAPLFLAGGYRQVLAGLRAGRAVMRAAQRIELAGLAAHALCRHRFIDDHLLAELAAGAEQLLVLGAGYDSRAYRFAAELTGRPVYEVDLGPTSQRKANIVAAHPDVFAGGRVNRVVIDFRTESLADVLLSAGFSVGVRTVVIWEGVLMYLDDAAVRSTLHTLRQICGTGSTLAMDCWYELRGSVLDDVRRVGAKAIGLIGEPVTFSLAPDAAPALLGDAAMDVDELLEWRELADRYATDGRHCEPSLYVVAARLRTG
jgi:methyltransferase (TIGR00027 family)